MLELKEKSTELAISLDLFRATLGLETNKFDDHLIRLIRAATEQVEEYTQRSITCKTWLYTHTNHILYLPRPIIQKVIQVFANGKPISDKEYKKGYTRDTTVILLDEKYMDCENSVLYQAGYMKAEEQHDIPDILVNVIFDYAKALFHKGLGAENNTADQVIKSLERTSYMPSFYMSERLKQESKSDRVIL
jgi:hypothetical protein